MWDPPVFNLSPLFLCSPNSLDGTFLSFLSRFNFSLLIFSSTKQPLKELSSILTRYVYSLHFSLLLHHFHFFNITLFLLLLVFVFFTERFLHAQLRNDLEFLVCVFGVTSYSVWYAKYAFFFIFLFSVFSKYFWENLMKLEDH